jgi:hypothetical protein
LPDVFNSQVGDAPLDILKLTLPQNIKNVTIFIPSVYGYLGGLQYFDIEGR